MISEDEFKTRFAATLDKLAMSKADAADFFYVSIPTLARWCTGASTPHPIMRETILKRAELAIATRAK